ncbi:hypothetical protein ACFQFC_24085 [Amorphoplanes digitatis]|uniref:hypothetical protein n=1 Tax=Actinoplanes digitatis TaxID=1868 RepID=UPI0036136CF0
MTAGHETKPGKPTTSETKAGSTATGESKVRVTKAGETTVGEAAVGEVRADETATEATKAGETKVGKPAPEARSAEVPGQGAVPGDAPGEAKATGATPDAETATGGKDDAEPKPGDKSKAGTQDATGSATGTRRRKPKLPSLRPPGAPPDPWTAFAQTSERGPGRIRRAARAVGRGLTHEYALVIYGSLLLAVLVTWPALRYPAHLPARHLGSLPAGMAGLLGGPHPDHRTGPALAGERLFPRAVQLRVR